MDNKYFIEDLDRIPISAMTGVFKANGVPGWLAVLILSMQRIKARLGFPALAQYGTAKSREVQPVDRSEMPEQAIVAWSPYLEQFQDAGFRRVGWLRAKTIGDKEEARAIFINDQGNTLGMLEWLRISTIQQVHYSMNSIGTDESEIISAVIKDHNPLLEPYIVPPYVAFMHVTSTVNVKGTYAMHQQRIANYSLNPLRNDNWAILYQSQSDRLFDFLRKKKILRELTPREIARLRT